MSVYELILLLCLLCMVATSQTLETREKSIEIAVIIMHIHIFILYEQINKVVVDVSSSGIAVLQLYKNVRKNTFQLLTSYWRYLPV